MPLLKLSDLPPRGSFILGAKLRAGALIRHDGWGPFSSYRMIPVNSYVQYVIRTSAIKDRAALLTSAPTREVQDPVDLGVDQSTKPPPSLLERLWNAFTALPGMLRLVVVAVAAVALLAVMWFIAPLRPIVSGLAKLVGGAVALVGSVLQKLADWLRRK